MQKKLFRQYILFIIFFVIGIWTMVRVFTEGFQFIPFLIGVLQILASLLFLKWNIFDGS